MWSKASLNAKPILTNGKQTDIPKWPQGLETGSLWGCQTTSRRAHAGAWAAEGSLLLGPVNCSHSGETSKRQRRHHTVEQTSPAAPRRLESHQLCIWSLIRGPWPWRTQWLKCSQSSRPLWGQLSGPYLKGGITSKGKKRGKHRAFKDSQERRQLLNKSWQCWR